MTTHDIQSALTAVKGAGTIEHVVNMINDSMSNALEPTELAAAYAVDAAEPLDESVGVTSVELSHHLDYLVEHGAVFDESEALSIALPHC